MTATPFCGSPLVRTVLETRFAKLSAGGGFGEPIGMEREHNARLQAAPADGEHTSR
jgi:hypothetical protein